MTSRTEIAAAVSKLFKQKPWDCPKCHEHFDGYNQLRAHGEKEHGIKKDGRIAGELGDLVAHYLNVTGNPIQPNAKGQFICPECKQAFTDSRPLGLHRSEVHKFVGMVQMQRLAQPNSMSMSERNAKAKEKANRQAKKDAKLALLAPTQEIQAPTQVIDIPDSPDFTAEQILDGVQRSLATLNLLIAAQRMSPEQMSALAGTLTAVRGIKQKQR